MYKEIMQSASMSFQGPRVSPQAIRQGMRRTETSSYSPKVRRLGWRLGAGWSAGGRERHVSPSEDWPTSKQTTPD